MRKNLGHRVHITKPFYLGQFKVTGGTVPQVRRGDEPHGREWKTAFPSQTDEHPVVNVSWDDATAFCKWLSAKEAKTYRLPTEAEWGMPACAGSTTKYWFGENANELGDYAWLQQQLRWHDPSRRPQEAQRMGTVRYARQRAGVVCGLVRRTLLRFVSQRGPEGAAFRQRPRTPGRLLGQ